MNSNSETTRTELTVEEQAALESVRDIKAFYQHLGTYVVIIGFLVFLNLMTAPGRLWVLWPAFGWGVGVAMHGLSVLEVFNFFGPEWERRQVQKRLNRDN